MTWTSATLDDVIRDLRARRGDTTTIEVKAAAGGCPDLGDTLCAFANMPDGGVILLGLDEESGFAAVGLTDVATLESGVASIARNAVSPSVACSFQTVQYKGNDVLVCTVPGLPLEHRPARYRGQAYLRQSDGDYVMSEQEVAQVELQKTQGFKRTHPDRASVEGATMADLDQGLLTAFLSSARASSRRHASASDAEILRRMGVLTASGDQLTVAGLYALGKYPQQFLPTLSITAAVQLPSGTAGRTRDLAHFDGPLPEMLDEALEWVRRNTRDIMGYDERGHGVDRPELPMLAIREIVANGLVHRNLDAVTDSKRVEIRLRDDRLVVTSPGGLWGVSEHQLGKPDGKSAVNVTLYEICKLARTLDGSRVIEGEGGGIREAMFALLDAGMRPAKFIDAGVRFTVVVSRHTLIEDEDLAWLSGLPDGRHLTSEQRAVLASMRHGEEWTNSQVRERLAPMDSVAARRMLQDLVTLGLAEMTGHRGGAAYRLSASVSRDDTSMTSRQADDLPARVAAMNGNAVSVWKSLNQPRTFRELADLVPLTRRQIRYALDQLRERDCVSMRGGQGTWDATYERAL